MPYNKGVKTNPLYMIFMYALMTALFVFSIGSASMPAVQAGAMQKKVTSIQVAVPELGGCQIFPENNYWNTPVDDLPVHPSSNAWVNSVGRTRGFHMDFGSGNWDGGPIGIPYNVVSGFNVTNYSVDFYYPDESDVGPYPIPATPNIEWGSDHHILIIDDEDCALYEIYDAWKQGGQWFGGSGAIWDLNSNTLRPDTWTSADAAGLPILPGLVRYEEILAGEINHALRFTTNCTANYYIWPARHVAQSGSCANPVPFGARFRLKADYDISGFSAQAKIILQAMKTYGIVLADNGSPWYVSGAPDANWDNSMLHTLDVLTGDDFEAVDTSSLMVNMDSGETPYQSWPKINQVIRADANPNNSIAVSFTVTFSHAMSGVDETDFEVSLGGGVSGAAVSGVSGSGSSYTVTVDTGSGDGTLRLDVVDDDTIVNSYLTPLGGVGAGNGDFTSGETYMIDKTPPQVSTITRTSASPSGLMTVGYLVTFTEAVTGVDVLDFALDTSGVTNASVVSVSGSGATRVVLVGTGGGDGTLRLDFVDNSTVTDLASNPSAGNFSGGQVYAVDKADLPAPVLRSPRSGMVTNNTTPVFWWRAVRGGQDYEIEFATDSNFTNIVDSQMAGNSSSHAVVTPFVDGIYYWRVRGYNSGGQAGRWSSSRVFRIDTLGPSAPLLVSPLDNATLRATPVFRWQASSTAVAYEFQYDNDADFSSPAHTATVRGTSRKPPAMKAGTYYWRVRARDATGNWGDWSAPFTITLAN